MNMLSFFISSSGIPRTLTTAPFGSIVSHFALNIAGTHSHSAVEIIKEQKSKRIVATRKRLRGVGVYKSFMGTTFFRARMGKTNLRGSTSPSQLRSASSNIGAADLHPLQHIYNELASIDGELFLKAIAEPYSCPQIVNCLKLMNQVTLSDLGLTERMVSSLRDSVCLNVASCYSVSEDRGFDITAFVLPQGATLPIHDHPDMTVYNVDIEHRKETIFAFRAPLKLLQVCSKVLSGSLQVLSLSPSASTAAATRARVVCDATVTAASPSWLLSPSEGNLHRFTALSPTVVLDLILPPYIEPQRPCRYYALEQPPVTTVAEFETEAVVFLRRLNSEEQNAVKLPYGVQYRGFRPIPGPAR